MTWRQLRDKLNALPDNVLDEYDVTVLLMGTDEVYAVMDFVPDWSAQGEARKALGIDQVDGVLDDNHPYLTVPA